jgi:hypothetical protein
VNPISTAARPPSAWTGPAGIPTGRSRAALYRQAGILVTHEVFEVGDRRYPVADLSRLHTVRGRRDRLTVRAVVLTGAVLIAVGTGLSFTRHPGGLSALTYLALLVGAFVPPTLAMIGSRVRPRSFELWGCYQGTTLPLFVTDDERRYGQVTRALLRAVQARRPGVLADPWASFDPWRPASR